ncbi:sigma 54-interacting transcriptional regulator [Mucilaginibacter phyllosphaerae]
MKKNILIIEESAIETASLQAILQDQDYEVTVSTPASASLILQGERKPDLLLLPVFIASDPNGLELAWVCKDFSIPFVFILPNSDQDTLESANKTQPYGFLSRPLRKKDVVSTIALGLSRHQHHQNFQFNLSKWLNGLLVSIMNCAGDDEQRLMWLIKAFQPFIQFDNVIVNLDLKNGGRESVYAFERLGLNEYRRKDHISYIRKAELEDLDLRLYRNRALEKTGVYVENGEYFDQGCKKFRFASKLREFYKINSEMTIPLVNVEKKLYASIGFYSTENAPFSHEQADLLRLAAPFVSNAIAWIKDSGLALNSTQKDGYSIDHVRSPEIFKNIVGNSLKLLSVLDQVTQVAPFDTTVLITGETGTGKESLVDAIHQLSSRNQRPLIKVNCAAIPETLIEAAFFGFERGAFTDASERKIGWFEKAHGGTIFLDEIGELPLLLQSKFLRVLQEKEIQRIGGTSTIKVDTRIIVATNKNLSAEVAAKHFRPDLYFRINVFPIEIPPLRERKEDIPLLVSHFINKFTTERNVPFKTVRQEALRQLVSYDWPGNIRELQSVVERTALTVMGTEIQEFLLPDNSASGENQREQEHLETYQEMERNHILKVLKSCKGKINGKGGAAEILDLPPTSLSVKMKKLKIGWHHTY